MSMEKSKNVLEEEHKYVHAKNLHKNQKDQHVYKNCYELRSRAIKHQKQTFFIKCWDAIFWLRIYFCSFS